MLDQRSVDLARLVQALEHLTSELVRLRERGSFVVGKAKRRR